MNNKTKIIGVAVILVIISFYGGVKYSQYQRSSFGRNFNNGGNQTAGINFSGNQRIGKGNLGGMINGEIISKDNTGITVKLQDGGSKIIFLSEKTKISKLTESSKDDLFVGSKITGSGISNPDGSVTAESIQIK